jgi:DNA-binding beta-propeller fold protein YncE
VLLDDRIAEHVPGCNMAFRREALVAIGGFNPLYLRAGDDVDVCWRLQARGWKIGFASSALVWHHHRSSVKGYWRQQVGYGEGERLLMAHHPDKFLDGRMLWRGRIYSPLPSVRSLWGTRINAGVWGTAPFPSVYRTDVHPFAFLPHSVRWQAISFVLTLAGVAVVGVGEHRWAAALLLGSGAVGFAVTIAKNVTYALRSDVGSLPGSRLWYRAVVAYLHFLQPFARAAGQIRGVLSPPEVVLPVAPRQTSRGPRPSIREAWRALLLLSGSIVEDRFWSETWTSADRVLADLTGWLRSSRAGRSIEVDEGWSHDRGVSVLVGRPWLDVRAVVEDHGAGKSLLRVSTHLRPTTLGILNAVAVAAPLLAAASAGVALRWPLAGVAAATVAVVVAIFSGWRTAQTTAILHRGVEAVAARQGMTAMEASPARGLLLAPSLLRMYGLRSAAVFLVMILALAAGTLMVREAATGQVIGERKGYAGDNGPAIQASLDTPGGIAVTSNGDVYFADSNNHVIRRIDAVSNNISTVVGNNALGAGFSGDYGPATKAQLDTPDGVAIGPDGDLLVVDAHNNRVRRVDWPTGIITTIAGSGEAGSSGDGAPALAAALDTPSAVAAAPNGDIYIADTLNYRIRMIDHTTGFIHTIAGDGAPADDGAVGDGGPATSAHLNMPSDVAIAPSGDIYIADMHHQRVRKVDARTRIITTVAGSGAWGHSGDGGPATQAAMAGPAGLAIVPEPQGQIAIFIADYYNGRVRAVTPDGIIRDVGEDARVTFGEPTRVAFAPKRGLLWVADSSRDRLVSLSIRRTATATTTPLRLLKAPGTAPKGAGG